MTALAQQDDEVSKCFLCDSCKWSTSCSASSLEARIRAHTQVLVYKALVAPTLFESQQLRPSQLHKLLKARQGVHLRGPGGTTPVVGSY